MTQQNWTVTKHHPSVVELRGGPKEFRVLALSDLHWDNAHCDRAALKRDLDEALWSNTPVILIGDTFCLMQGKWDKRKDEKQLRPEHRGGNYLDRVVDTAVDWFKPYAKIIALVTRGNHESSILQYRDSDVTARFCEGLRLVANGKFTGALGAYAGFLKIVCGEGAHTRSKVLNWHHGYGGGGEVTRGMIDQSRTRSQYFADIYISGHIHRRNSDENVISYLDQSCNTIRTVSQWFLRSGTYKRECGTHEQDMSGWHVEKGRSSRPIGGWWLDFRVIRENDNRVMQFLPRATWS